jgi:putative ABC transport system permease protein
MSLKKNVQIKRQLFNLGIALNALVNNKFRSILTALGVIFGVAAVISMMAIGKGTKLEILDQMKQVGVNNIVILPVLEDEKESAEEDDEGKMTTETSYSPGLRLADALAIESLVPTVSRVSPEIIFETQLIKDGIKKTASLNGITPEYFSLFNKEIYKGRNFNESQIEQSKSVCLISYDIESRFFTDEEALGKYIKCDNVWFQIIGVLAPETGVSDNTLDMGISSGDNSIYIPIQTLLLRYKNRSLVNARVIAESYESDENEKSPNWNQLDKIVVQVKETGQIKATTEIIHRLLLRRHAQVEDFKIHVPELLLKQQERTKNIFSIVLIAIASISLVVGGIGIMNIMLASVMERTREIGIRRAIGATKRDIAIQFVSEATMISISGGILGILLGFILSWFFSHLSVFIPDFKDIPTANSFIAVFVSFVVSVSIGIIFGYVPAKRAAEKDPVESLHHE